ncbi:RNA pseudouridine synthase family [Verrucomicrobiia bacterium DG1235]|nr:RNA pseudouridine synthase family [Verrucomicrobiae bacterium DG1235]
MLSEGGGDREVDLEQAVSELMGRQCWCCHRLDRLTSGVVVLRKGRRFVKELAGQFESRGVRKEYWLLVDGLWDRRIQKMESQIASIGRGKYANVESGGKAAASTFRVLGLDEERRVSWMSGLLKTGRTHQLRLHALKAGCPVVGDPLYGKSRDDGLFGLHARSLRMRHPASGEELSFEAEPPDEWRGLLERFES